MEEHSRTQRTAQNTTTTLYHCTRVIALSNWHVYIGNVLRTGSTDNTGLKGNAKMAVLDEMAVLGAGYFTTPCNKLCPLHSLK